MQRFYLPHFEKQLTGSYLASTNCGAASGAMLVDQATLGLKDPSPEMFRRQTGDMEGGLLIGGIQTAMEHFGVPVTAYDYTDDLEWPTLLSMLRAGRFAVVSGDYGALPVKYRGDKDFVGNHSVVYQAVTASGIRVGDPLNDGRRPGIPKGWQVWPIDVARDYVMRFSQPYAGGIYAVVMQKRQVEVRVVANVRLHPARNAFILATFNEGKRLTYGGTEMGEPFLGNRTWFRVWVPSAEKVGYVHASTVKRV